MILRSLHVAGFGKLVDRRFEFSPGLNVVYGSNESGKSTLAGAIVATLYGVDRKKEAWRPWSAAPFTATLTYRLANGEQIEVQRDFDRDAKGVRVYDRNGNDLASQLGQKLVPGEAHLGVPLDVFLNAACVKQQSIAIDEGKDAVPIAAHLARALDGGPREDAALGAIHRLEEALRLHVGSERARKNAPLRAARAKADEQRANIAAAHARLDALEDLRDRLETANHERERYAAAAAEIERRLRSLRAGAIANGLASLHAYRTELAALQADRAAYDDVAQFAQDREPEVNAAFTLWEAAGRVAAAAQTEAESAKLTETERIELDRRRRDAGAIDDRTYDALAAANTRANSARLQAVTAAREAASARVDGEQHPTAFKTIVVAGLLALCVTIGFAIAHNWTWTGVGVVLAIAGLGAAFGQNREQAKRRDNAAQKQRLADDAQHAEETAANAVSAVLDPLGMERFEELIARRSRLGELLTRKRSADAAIDRARASRHALETAAARFDSLAAAVAPDADGDRAARKSAINARAARKRERDGLDAHLHALEMRRSTILGNDDEYALEAERDELLHDGVEASDEPFPGARRAIDGERTVALEHLRTAGELAARLAGELTGAQVQIPDLAALDEALVRTQNEIARLEEFERAVLLAKSTLEKRTQEAHQAFARRLEDYAAATLSAITAGRYGEIFVDPTTLSIRVRIPETQAITDLDSLSAGTRDQTYLVVRFAMARMFSEGIETPPLLLDDPFAYWDAARIERCLPIIERGAHDAQAILFTASRELADAAQRGGAHRLDLPEPVAV